MADRTNNPGTSSNTESDRSQTDRQNPDLNTEEGGMSGSSSNRDSLSDRSRSTGGNSGSRNTNVTGDESSQEEGGMSGSSGRSESETTDRQSSTDEGYGSSRVTGDPDSTSNR